MRIPTYDEKETPQDAGSGGGSVFRSGVLKETARVIPVLDQEAKSQQRFGKVAFDIGIRLQDAYDADQFAEAKKNAFEEYSKLQDLYKDQKTLDPESPNYISPQDLDKHYDGASKDIQRRIMEKFDGRRSTKQKLDLYLKDYHNHDLVKTNGITRARKVTELQEKFYKRQDVNLEQAQVAYNKGDMDAIARLMEQTESDIAGAVASQILTAKQGNALEKTMQIKANDAIQTSDIDKAYQLSIATKSKKPLEDLIEERYSKPDAEDVMTENMRIQYKLMAQRLLNRVENEIKSKNYLEEARLADEMDDAIAEISSKGKGQVQDVFGRIGEVYADEPEKAEAIRYKFDQELLKAGATYLGVDNVRNTSLHDVAKDGWFDEQAGNLRPEIREHVKKAMGVEAIRKARVLAVDPLTYLQDLDIFKRMTAEHNAAMKDQFTPDEAKAQIHADYLNGVAKLQKEQGVVDDNIRMMTVAEAKGYVSAIMESSPLDKVKEIERMEAYYGDQWNTAFKDLQREEMPEGMQIVGALSNEADQPQIKLDMAESMSLTNKEFSEALGVEMKEIRISVNEAINKNDDMLAYTESIMAQGATDENVQHIGAMKDAVRRLTYLYTMKNGDLGASDAMADKAVRDTISNLYNFTGDNKQVRIPKDYNVPAVNIGTRNIQLGIQPDKLSQTKYANPKGFAREIRDDGYWANSGTDKLVLKYNGLVVYDKDEKPIEFIFEDSAIDKTKPLMSIAEESPWGVAP